MNIKKVQKQMDTISRDEELYRLFFNTSEAISRSHGTNKKKQQAWRSLIEYTNKMRIKLDMQEHTLSDLNEVCDAASVWWINNPMAGKLTSNQRANFAYLLEEYLNYALAYESIAFLDTDVEGYATGLLEEVLDELKIEIQLPPNLSMSVNTHDITVSGPGYEECVYFNNNSSDPGMKID